MSQRRRFSEKDVLATLISQGIELPCYRCREPITADDIKVGNVEREHLHEVALGGPDEPGNCRYSHKGKPCHQFITHGTPATRAGSSRHKIGKTLPARVAKFVPTKIPLDAGIGRAIGKCRGCGQFEDDCICPKRIELSPLSGKRRRERAMAGRS